MAKTTNKNWLNLLICLKGCLVIEDMPVHARIIMAVFGIKIAMFKDGQSGDDNFIVQMSVKRGKFQGYDSKNMCVAICRRCSRDGCCFSWTQS
jgi:hypothetical protein